MKDRLATAVRQSRADYTEIRVERTWASGVAFRGRRLETATVSEDQGGFVRVLNDGYGWGIASFTSLDELPAMVKRANELSRAIRLDEPIQLECDASMPRWIASSVARNSSDGLNITNSVPASASGTWPGGM